MIILMKHAWRLYTVSVLCRLLYERGTGTFFEPAKPSDSVKKYVKGRRMTRERLKKRNTTFHSPVIRHNTDKERIAWTL